MKTTNIIEKYRGIDIWFNTDAETFQCDIDDERSIKKSYSAIKKFIDEYSKENSNFKPFFAESLPGGWSKKGKIRVVGVRKDGAFIMEDEKGNKSQLSKYDEKDYMTINPDNQIHWDDLKKIRERISELRDKEKEVIARFNVVTIKYIKSNLV